ncbi:hypothetical protein Pan216_41620 [Planctomycetes bacterium Pan216]|uniref:Uncharacterized protein n=1 Tax=Kolteria novifilia TaxID=2527975 RepID=A0A518B8H4_9BACT|nr:hypothetical protein Pan216_41620 [Planctomycetes bacterium Pan216]
MAMVTALAVGCGKKPGPDRYEISGNATFNGKPIPAGEISFSPNSQKGNKGPGSLAIIKDGKYQTTSGKGLVGGAYVARVIGFDGVANEMSEQGMPIFESFEVEFEAPMESTTRDFEVPASAASAKAKR